MAVESEKRRRDVIRIGGFRHIVDRAKLYGRHCGGDIAVSGENDAPRIGPALLEREGFTVDQGTRTMALNYAKSY